MSYILNDVMYEIAGDNLQSEVALRDVMSAINITPLPIMMGSIIKTLIKYNIKGDWIDKLYNNICDRDAFYMIAVIKGIELKYITPKKVMVAMKDETKKIDVKGIFNKVRDKHPNWLPKEIDIYMSV